MSDKVYNIAGKKLYGCGFQFDYKGYIISCSFILQDWADVGIMKQGDRHFFIGQIDSVQKAIKIVDSITN